MSIPILDVTQIAEGSTDHHSVQLQKIARSVVTALRAYPHYLVVNGYPCDLDRVKLKDLAKAIRAGDTSKSTLGFSGQSQKKISFTKVQIDLDKANANKRVTQYSRTHLPLTPHTDSSYMPRPHELVAFQCIVPEPSGGESIFIPIEDLLQQLERETIQLLRAPVYSFGNRTYPILVGESGHERIRYYRAQIERTQEEGIQLLPKQYLAVLEKLDTVLEETKKFSQFHLEKGQIVLMHNQKVLHGRTGFSSDSDRLLYRIRLHVDSLADVQLTQTDRKPTETVQTEDVQHLNRPSAQTAIESKQNLAQPLSPLTAASDAIVVDSGNQAPPPSNLTASGNNSEPIVTVLPPNSTIHKISKQTEVPKTEILEQSSLALKQAEVHLAKAEKLDRLRRFKEALVHYLHACQLAPNSLVTFKAYGKFLLRRGQFAESAQIYLRCLKIDPTDYESGLALSSLANSSGNKKTAENILKQVIRHHPYVFKHPPDPQKKTLLRIRSMDGSAYNIIRGLDGSYKYLLQGGHFSIGNLVEKENYNLVILNIFDNNIDTLTDFPKVNLILNTLACPDLKRLSLLAAARFIDHYPTIPVINNPRRVLETTRERNSVRLNLIPGVSFPKTEKLIWDGISLDSLVKEVLGLGFTFPIIIRQVGSQTGMTVALIENETKLRDHFLNCPANQEYYVIQFQDCSNSQRIFNKIRMFFVDGNLYPIANLFLDSWNVHSGDRYQIMDKMQWTQNKEKSFLNDPVSYLGKANINKLYQIRDMVELDFFGIDFTVLQDGTLFIFELNAAMRHNFDHAKNFPYTTPYLQQASNAFNTMIQRRLQV